MGRTYDQQYAEFAAGAMRDLRRMAYLMCHDWHRAEDIAHDTLLKMYDAWPRIRDHDGLMPYARKALLRAFIDNRRRPWHREALIDPPTTRMCVCVRVVRECYGRVRAWGAVGSSRVRASAKAGLRAPSRDRPGARPNQPGGMLLES